MAKERQRRVTVTQRRDGGTIPRGVYNEPESRPEAEILTRINATMKNRFQLQPGAVVQVEIEPRISATRVHDLTIS